VIAVVIVAGGDRRVVRRVRGGVLGVLAGLIEAEPSASKVAVLADTFQPGRSLATEVWILLGLAGVVRRRVAPLSLYLSLSRYLSHSLQLVAE
jgi:hypothetical protein